MPPLSLTVDPAALRRLRLAAALSQRELAAAAGLDRLTVTNLEAGRPARLASIRKLAHALGVQPAAFAQIDAA